jgi:hypothetical protein
MAWRDGPVGGEMQAEPGSDQGELRASCNLGACALHAKILNEIQTVRQKHSRGTFWF